MKISVILFALACTFCVPAASAQNVFTTGPGAWNNTGIWSSPIVPNAANTTTITVMHDVTIPAGFSVTIDGTTINSGATVTVQSGGTLTIAAGAGSLIVSGTLAAQQGSLLTGTNGTNVSFGATSSYRHQFTTTQGVIPLATWNAGSTLEISGYTSFASATVAGNWSQSFGHVFWNCASQSNIFGMNGLLTSISGSLTIQQTGSGALFLSATQNPVINIGQDLVITGSSRTFLASASNSSPGTIVNIGRDFIYNTSNTTASALSGGGLTTANVTRDFIMNTSGGSLRLGSIGSTAIGKLNVGRNFTLTSGTITETSADPGYGEINFEGGTGFHDFQNTGTITNNIHYNIPVGNSLTLLNESALTGDSGSTLNLDGILRVQSTNTSGAIQNGPSLGNIRTTIRNYNSGSQVVFAGTAAQFMGSGHPTVLTTTTVIENASGVTLASIVALGNLRINTGNLTVHPYQLTVNGALELIGGNVLLTTTTAPKTITLNGLLSAGGGQIILNSGGFEATLNVNGTLSGTNGFTSTGSNTVLNFGGTGSTGGSFPLTASTTSVKTVTVNRTGGTIPFSKNLTVVNMTASNGSIQQTANTLTISNSLNLTTGTTLFFGGATLVLQKSFNNSSTGGLLSADGSSLLSITGSGTLSGALAFSPAGNTIGNLTLNRTGSGTLVTLNSALNISGVMTLQAGSFANTSGLSFSNGATLVRNSAGTLTGAIPTGGPYNLIYIGGSLSNSQESKGSLNNITSSVSGTVTLTSALTGAGLLSVTSGTFTAGANAVTIGSFSNAGIFNAPSGTLTLSGNFTNTGTFNKNSGTVVFNGTSNISGTPLFHHITITGILNSPATLNLAGNFVNNGTLNAGTGTVLFSGASLQTISGSVTTAFNNLSISNTTLPVGVQITSNQNLTGLLTLAANVKFDPDGPADNRVFTFRSTTDNPADDASLAPVPSGASILGNVMVQRFISQEGKVLRYIAMPVQNVRVDSLQDDFTIVGPFAGSSYPCTGCPNNNYSLRYYDETVLGAQLNGEKGFPTVNNAEQMTLGRGYWASMHEGNLHPIRLDMTGAVFTGSFNYPVSYSPSSPANATNDGWNLLGNPYPSAIVWDWNNSATWDRNNIRPTVFVYDKASNATRYFNASTLVGDIPGGVIASGQSFWIQTIGASPVLQIKEAAKISGVSHQYYRQRSPSDHVIVSLKQNDFLENAFLVEHEEATAGFDELLDAYKLENQELELASLDPAGERMAINTVKNLSSVIMQPLFLRVENPGVCSFTFKVTNESLVNEMVLYDRKTGIQTLIKANEEYSFIAEVAGTIEGRFYITQKDNLGTEELPVSDLIEIYPNPSNEQFFVKLHANNVNLIRVLNQTGAIIWNYETRIDNDFSLLKVDAQEWPSGIYVMQVFVDGERVTRKLIKN